MPTCPQFVVDKVDWIQCRYLIVQRGASYNYTPAADVADDPAAAAAAAAGQLTRAIPLDPLNSLTIEGRAVSIPDILPKLEAMNRKLDATAEDLNESDDEVLKEPPPPAVAGNLKKGLGPSSSRTAEESGKDKDTFVPAGPEILKLVRVLPPPRKPNPGAVRQITGEVRAMLKEQERVGPSACGFYLDPVRPVCLPQ